MANGTFPEEDHSHLGDMLSWDLPDASALFGMSRATGDYCLVLVDLWVYSGDLGGGPALADWATGCVPAAARLPS